MRFNPLIPSIIILGIAWIVFIIRIIGLFREASTISYLQKSTKRRVLSVIRWACICISLVCLVITAYKPEYIKFFLSESALEQTQQNENIYLVVDSSPTMKTQDTGYTMTRMERARKDMLDIILKHPKAHFSLITYGSSARLDWPLTQDVWSLLQFVRSLSGYDTTTFSDMQSTDPWEAAKFLKAEIVTQYKNDPLTTNWVYFFSDGDPLTTHTDDHDTSIKYSEIPYVNGGAVFMYGTSAGGDVIAFTIENKPMLVDSPTGTLIVKSNPKLLHAIADKMNIQYIDRSQDKTSMNSVINNNMMHPSALTTHGNNQRSVWPLYWCLALTAAILLSIEYIFLVFSSPVIPRLLSVKEKRKES